VILMPEKKLSIITVTYNSEKYLEQTIQSIANQTYRNKEYIIIDGGSTDGTLNIIKKYENKISYWISESDNGIADAMNKGLKVAAGDYVLFIHSDDYLIDPTVLEKSVTYIDDKFDIYVFQVIFDKNGDKKISLNRGFSWWTNFKMGSCHQGQVCSRSLLERLGGFNTTFRINMDYDLILRAYRNGARSKTINLPISIMRLTGISSRLDWPGLSRRLEEERLIHQMNTPNVFMSLVYSLYWFLYIRYRKTQYSLSD